MNINFTFFQIILIIISISFLFSGLWKFIRREQNQTFFKVVYTTLIWGSVLFLSIFPDHLRVLSIKFGLGENLNTIIFIGFVLVFMAIFKLLNSVEKLEQTISELVRKDALNDLDRRLIEKDEK